MLHCLATIAPLHIASGERRIVRAASANRRDITSIGGHIWEPAIAQAPAFRITLFNGDFQAAVSPGAATLPLQMAAIKKSYPWADECAWKGAEVEIRVGKPGDAWPWKLAFKGRVSGYERKGQVLSLSAEASLDDKDVLTAAYAGTGLIEGDADLKGKVKPLAIGWPKNVEPVLINAVDSVYQFSAYGPIEAVTTLYERGSDFGASTGDHATYAALVAASIPAGRWAACLAQGLVRLGAPQAGVITADLKGHIVGTVTPRLTGAIISALAGIAGIAEVDIEAETLDALDLAVPFNVNLNLVDQIKFLDVARRMALPCNHQSGVSLEGKFFVLPISFDASPTFALEAQGRSWPQVIELPIEQETSPPFWRTVLGAERAWRVHSAEEISFSATLIERGPYSDTETYREGNWVSQPDGSTWIYIAVEASAGNSPPVWPTASNAWWANRTAPGGTNSTYADGTPIDDLRPAEPYADVTSTAVPRHEPNGISTAFTANHLGAIDAGQLPRTIQIKRFRGITDVSSGAVWTLVSQGAVSGATVTVVNGAVVIPTGVGIPPGTAIQVKSAHDGVDITGIISVTRLDAAPPSTGGSGGTTVTDNSLNSVTGTTMVALSDEMTVHTGSAGSIAFGGGLSIIAPASSPVGTFGADMRWKYKSVGGIFSDVGAANIPESVAAVVTLESGMYFSENGSINVAASQTGLSASTDYVVQLWGARDSAGPAKTISFGGSVSATGS